MSPIEQLKQKWYFFKYNFAKPDSVKFYKRLMHDQYKSADEIESLSWKRTCKLLQYAYKHVPFYRNRFESNGVPPAEIRTPKDFLQIPLLTRQDLSGYFDQLISDEASKSDMNLVTTGGSTGIPVKVYHQKRVPRAAMGWRVLDWWGISPADNWASVYRNVQNSFQAKLLHTLQYFPTKHLLMEATCFSVQDMAHFLQQCQSVKPRLLHGYVGAMDILAGYMLDNHIQIPPPKAIWVTSAPITKVQQKRIETAFQAPVYDQYGCCEIYWLAAECPARKGLHMFQDIRHFEFLDDQGHPLPYGEYGNIVITDLENHFFPLIRYVNGDQGRRLPHACSCGCNLPLMDKVQGRISDSFKFPSGIRLNGEFLTTLFDDFPEAVKQFQVHQQSDYSIRIRVVPNQDYREYSNILKSVRDKLFDQIHGQVPVVIEEVEFIPLSKGKPKFVVSDVS